MVIKAKITLALFILVGFIGIAFLAASIVFFYEQSKLWEAGLMALSLTITTIYWIKFIFKLIEIAKKE